MQQGVTHAMLNVLSGLKPWPSGCLHLGWMALAADRLLGLLRPSLQRNVVGLSLFAEISREA